MNDLFKTEQKPHKFEEKKPSKMDVKGLKLEDFYGNWDAYKKYLARHNLLNPKAF